MQIIVEISESKDGRAAGTVRAEGQSQARPFSGNLEFLALIESLYQAPKRPASRPWRRSRGSSGRPGRARPVPRAETTRPFGMKILVFLTVACLRPGLEVTARILGGMLK